MLVATPIVVCSLKCNMQEKNGTSKGKCRWVQGSRRRKVIHHWVGSFTLVLRHRKRNTANIQISEGGQENLRALRQKNGTYDDLKNEVREKHAETQPQVQRQRRGSLPVGGLIQRETTFANAEDGWHGCSVDVVRHTHHDYRRVTSHTLFQQFWKWTQCALQTVVLRCLLCNSMLGNGQSST